MSTLFYPIVTFLLIAICISYWAVTAVYPSVCVAIWSNFCYFMLIKPILRGLFGQSLLMQSSTLPIFKGCTNQTVILFELNKLD